MRGQILSFDDASGAGLISGDDGIRYSFVREAVAPPASITAGLRVDFVPVAGEATNIMLLAAAPAPSAPSATPGVPVESFDFQHVFLSFNGRIRRQHFWIGLLICWGVGLASWLVAPIAWLVDLALIWPRTAITVKRLHDIGQTGWLAVIPVIAGVFGTLLTFAALGLALLSGSAGYSDAWAAAVPAMIAALPLILLTWIIQLGFLLWIGISDSQRGDNRFGPNPKGE